MRKVRTITGLATMGIVATTMLGAAIPASAAVGGDPGGGGGVYSPQNPCNRGINKLPAPAAKQLLDRQLLAAKNVHTNEMLKIQKDYNQRKQSNIKSAQHDLSLNSDVKVRTVILANRDFSLAHLSLVEEMLILENIAKYENTVNISIAHYYLTARENVYTDPESLKIEAVARLVCKQDIVRVSNERIKAIQTANNVQFEKMTDAVLYFKDNIIQYETKTLAQLVEMKKQAFILQDKAKTTGQKTRAQANQSYIDSYASIDGRLAFGLPSGLYTILPYIDLTTIVKKLAADTTWNAVTSSGATASAFTYTAGTKTLSMPATNLVPSMAISIPNVNISSSSTVQGGIIAGTTFTKGGVVTNNDNTHGWCIMVRNHNTVEVYGARSVAGGKVVPDFQTTISNCSAAGVMS